MFRMRRKAGDASDSPNPEHAGDSSAPDGQNKRTDGMDVASIEMLLVGNLDTGNPDLTKEHTDAIAEACEPSALFDGLKDEVCTKLYRTFHGPIKYEPGQPIFYQGHVGRNFFVIYNGTVDISVHANNGEKEHVRTMRAGQAFGELALLRRTMRSANATAGTEAGCELLLMDRRTFQHLLKSEAFKRREARLALCNSVPVLKNSLSEYQMHILVDAMRDCDFDAGMHIIEQGKSETGALHIIRKGEVSVTLQGAVAPIKIMKTGDYFGELSLLSLGEMKEDSSGRKSISPAAPTANCVASAGGCSTIVLTREDFTRLLGPEALESLRVNSKEKGYVFDERSGEDIHKNISGSGADLHASLRKQQEFSMAQKRGMKVTLADIVLVKELGRGLLGAVHLAVIRNTKQLVALKAMKKRDVISLNQVKHVNDELRALHEVQCPFVASIIASFQDAKRLFIVVEYLPGSELFELLKAAGPLEAKEARFYGSEVLVALSYIHRAHYAYRDLKPENIMIDASGHIKLIDFGFAKSLRPGEKTYTSCGTLDYMAPEVVLVSGHDHMVDLYGLGVLLYEMQTCFPPFGAETDDERVQRILGAKLSFPAKFDEAAKETVEGLLERSQARRLGAGVNGIVDVMKSAFFKTVNFEKVDSRSYKPCFLPNDLLLYDNLADDVKLEAKRTVSSATRAQLEPVADPDFPFF